MLPLLTVYLILYLIGISGNGWAKKIPPKMRNNSFVASFHLAISPMVSCLFCEEWEAGVKNRGTFRILLFINIIHRNYTRIYNIQSFFLPRYRCDFWKSILSISHELADEYPAETLDSCSGTQNVQKST